MNAHEGWEFEPGDKNLVAMPLFHVGGTSYALFGIHDGVPGIMTREPDAQSLAAAIMGGATNAFLVPAVAAAILSAGDQAIALFSKLKIFCYGAAPMPLPLLRAALAAWPDTKFIQVYGMTEMSGVITHLLPEAHLDADHPERLASAGTVLPGAEVRVVDAVTLEDVAPGESGELWFRTEQLMKGFLNKPEETNAVITEEGWIRTGDIGRVDDGGFVFVEDRLKDMIITGGENVYSPRSSASSLSIRRSPRSRSSGCPTRSGARRSRLSTRSRRISPATPEELIAYARGHLAGYKTPSSI